MNETSPWVHYQSLQQSIKNHPEAMAHSNTDDLQRNGKSITNHADIEKQETHESYAVPVAAPKSLGAGVSLFTNNRGSQIDIYRPHCQLECLR
jgi:hypothetical protein